MRNAKCCDCGRIVPTTDVKDDPTFTNCDAGSQYSSHMCVVCGSGVAGHDSKVSTKDHKFQPGFVEPFDDYQCEVCEITFKKWSMW